jgi:hypothetical protein
LFKEKNYDGAIDEYTIAIGKKILWLNQFILVWIIVSIVNMS